MANQITGKIYKMTPTQAIVSPKTGNTFYKREIVLDASRFDQYTGERKFDNYPMLEFSGEQGCRLLDEFKEGELVTVSFDLNGTQYQDKQTGETRYFTRVRAYKIERAGLQAQPQSAPPQAAPAQAAPQPQPQPPGEAFPPEVDDDGLPF